MEPARIRPVVTTMLDAALDVPDTMPAMFATEPHGAVRADRVDRAAHDRMQALALYDLADWHLHQQLDAIAMRSAEALHQPFSMIALMLDHTVHVAGSHGLPGGWAHGDGDAPDEWAFCAETVLDGRPHLIPDLSVRPTSQVRPMVTGEGVISYGAFPLIVPSGQVIGAHCVLGRFPHVFSPAEISELRSTADEVVRAFEQHPAHRDRGHQERP